MNNTLCSVLVEALSYQRRGIIAGQKGFKEFGDKNKGGISIGKG